MRGRQSIRPLRVARRIGRVLSWLRVQRRVANCACTL